jgi:hypothetical protein
MPFGFGRKKPAANNTDKKLTVNKTDALRTIPARP